MSDNKKDLTRIEDLGEYLHQLGEDTSTPFNEEENLPDLPTEHSDFSEASTEEEPIAFEIPASESFNSEEISFPSADDPFMPADDTEEFKISEFDSDPIETPIEPETVSVPQEHESLFAEEDLIQESSLDFQTQQLVTEETIEQVELYSSPNESFKTPENFEDLRKFAESSSFSGMGVEGNPSFSVLIRDVSYIEDIGDIVTMLKELKLLTDDEESVKSRLMRGHLLIPRISEYAAIFLSHKLRRFDIDLQVGLSDEIHPPKHQETPEIGIVSRHSLYQNQSHHFDFGDDKLDISQIILATSAQLEGYQIIRYVGVATEHKLVASLEIENDQSSEIPQLYSELSQKLKAHAVKARANAVIGINYQLTPIPSEFGIVGDKYRLSCTGNLVWANKL